MHNLYRFRGGASAAAIWLAAIKKPFARGKIRLGLLNSNPCK